MTKPQVLGVGEVLSLETTPLDPVDRAEYDTFVGKVEPLVRRSLIAAHGPALGRSAALDALAWAWLHWDRVVGMRSPAAHLVRVGTISTRGGRDAGLVDTRLPSDQSQSELTQAFATVCGRHLAAELAVLVPSDRVAVLLTVGWGTPIGEVARLSRASRSTIRRRGERVLERLGSGSETVGNGDNMADALRVSAAAFDASAPAISSAEVIEHAEHLSARLPHADEVVEEQSRRRLIIGVVAVVAAIVAVLWWAGGRSNVVSDVAPTTTATADASAFAPTGIAAQSELTVYPILSEAPEGYRLIDRSLTLDASQTFGQVITGLVRNDPEPWRRRLWLFDPNGRVVASIATFDFVGSGELDFSRTIDVGGVSIEVGQDPRNGYPWWAVVSGVSAGSSTTGSVYIARVADEATVTTLATEVADLDARDPQFDVVLAANLGPGWQTYREPRTVDIATARYERDDGWSSIVVSSFAAPVQSNFDIIYPAAGPSIVIRQVDGPMFVSVAAVPPDSVDAVTMNRIADSVQLVRREAWDSFAVETIETTTPPLDDLLPTGLTSTEGGAVSVGIPNGQLCIRLDKSPDPIRSSTASCEWLRGGTGASTASLATIATSPSSERFIAGAAISEATRIRYDVIGADGVITTTETPLIRDPSLGPALWALRIPPAARLLSVEYLDESGTVLDRLGPLGA